MMNEVLNNPMRENAWDVPALVRSQCAEIERNGRMVLTTPEIWQLRRIIVIGCGDSYAAGLSMKPAMERLTGLPVEVMPAMQLARYAAPDTFGKPGSTLVMAVSNSGAVARVAEAVQRARHYGCLTLAITAKPESALAKAAEKRIPISIPAFPAGPGNGVRSYAISMLSLLLTAIRIGEVLGRYMMTDSEAYRKAVCGYADAMAEALTRLDRQMWELAQANTSRELFDFVGSGGSNGTAWFSQAKIIEATGDYAAWSDMESWMHLNCFFRALDRKFTAVWAEENGPDRSRAEETISAIAAMRGTVVVITDGPAFPVPDGAVSVVLPAAAYDWLSPLLNYLPMALFAGYLCELKHESYGRGGRDDWAVTATTRLLTDSRIEIL